MRAVLRAANRAQRADIRIHSFAIGPEALEGPIAAVEMASRTRGYFTPVRNPGDLVDIVEEVSFANIEKVTLEHAKTRVEAKPFRVTADGSWAGFVALEPGANTIRATAVAERRRDGGAPDPGVARRRAADAAEAEPAGRSGRAAQPAARGLPADRAAAAPRRASRSATRRSAARCSSRSSASGRRRASAPISSASSSSSRARTTARTSAAGGAASALSAGPCALAALRDGEVALLAEHLERLPARHLRHARHARWSSRRSDRSPRDRSASRTRA